MELTSDRYNIQFHCSKCGKILRHKREYGKYPHVKNRDYENEIDTYYRINPNVRFLKPSKTKQKIKGVEYIHYRISTTVPEEWKDGVKLTIEPIPPDSDIKELRQGERDRNELGPPDAPLMQELQKKYDEEEGIAELDRWIWQAYMNQHLETFVKPLIEEMNAFLHDKEHSSWAPLENMTEKPGMYLIYGRDGGPIYVGGAINLKSCLLRDFKNGNVENSQFRKALKQTFSFKSEEEITKHISDNYSYQFEIIEDPRERIKLEHFIIAILVPFLNIHPEN